MQNSGLRVRANNGIVVLFLLIVTSQASPLKAFNNPLNSKAVDLFLVVDENNTYMNAMQLGLVKTALHNIAMELNPSGSTPYFGAYFYGATTTVRAAVPYAIATAAGFKTKLDLLQYSTVQPNPSALTTALNTVHSLCQSSCRDGVPRVTVIFSSAPDTQAELTIRQLERNHGMTVILVGIGSSASASVLNRLASHPARDYSIPVGSFFELIVAAPHIASVISDVPRLLNISTNNPLIISSVAYGIYHTIQLNTLPYTTTSDTIIMLASNCPTCAVYASLSEPNPTSTNTVASNNRYKFYANAPYPNTLSYFRIPRNAGRLYVSLLGNGMSSLYILAYVFPLPNMLQISTRDSPVADLSQTIG